MKKIGKRDTILSLLGELPDDNIRPDEFTLSDYLEIAKSEGRSINRKRAGETLNRLCDLGNLDKRQACINSRIVNVYCKK